MRDLALASDTLIVLMARSNLEDVAAALAGALGKSRPAALVSNATWPDQRTVSAALGDIARVADRERIEAPATLIVGDVVAAAPYLSLPQSELTG
jgi:uroporphyrin-III C-methyltransferase